MATGSGNNTNGILFCPICLEKLNNPKYLPCLHTFCEGCIQKHFTSVFENRNTDNINCPICRFAIPVTLDDCSPEKWATDLPVNVLIRGLLEKGKVQQDDKRCMSCERMDVQSDARVLCVTCSDMLCDNCRNCHKTNKFTSEHDIRSFSESPVNEMLPKTFDYKCFEHKTKKLKFFCTYHAVPCCTMCALTDHRKCDDVISLHSAAQNFMSEEKVDRIDKDLGNYHKDVNTIISHIKKNLVNFESQYQAQVETIERVCKEFIGKIEEFEIKKKSQLQKIYDQKNNELETHIVILENCLKRIENEMEILKVSKNESCDVQVMLEAMKIDRKMTEHKATLREEGKNCSENYELTFENIGDVQKAMTFLDTAYTINLNVNQSPLELINFVKEPSIYKINRFSELSSSEWIIKQGNTNAIYFSVTQDILITEVLCYQCREVSNFDLTITIRNSENKVCEETYNLKGKDSNSRLIILGLSKPLKINSNTQYLISLRTNENLKDFYYGICGRSTVETEGVVFKFENVRNSETSTVWGQLPGFRFMIDE